MLDNISLFKLEKSLSQRTSTSKNISLLEFGTGEGIVLMEIKKRFPNIEMIGLNGWKNQIICEDKDLIESGLHYKILTKKEAYNGPKPKLVTHDATKGDLPFEDNHFDYIISQISTRYIKHKKELIESFWRILKPNGHAVFTMQGLKLVPGPKCKGKTSKDFYQALNRQGIVIKNGITGDNKYNTVYLQKSKKTVLSLPLKLKNKEFKKYKYGGFISEYEFNLCE